MAHRGAWGAAPQNTLAAFEHAIAIGADTIEVDVRRTLDGHLIAHHDAYAAGARIQDLRRAEVSTADGGPPPLLDEVLELAGARIAVDVELKEPDVVADAVALLRRFGLERCLVTSFLERALAQAAVLEPGLRTGLLIGGSSARDSLARMRRCGADQLALEASLASAPMLRRLLTRRTPCLVWTVNEPAAIDRFLQEPAIAALITDQPALALERRRLLGGPPASAMRR